MKKIISVLTIIVLVLVLSVGCSDQQNQTDWKLGIQTYTFHKFTLMETLEKSEQLGLKYAEAFFFQEMGEGFADTAYFNYDISDECKLLLKEKLKTHSVKLYACGVAFYGSENEWRRFFEFSAEMGLKMITAEPKLEDLDLVEALAKEYNIEVAIHNHPSPSVYANPNILEKALEGRSDLLGVCADIGHWKREGFDPLENIKRFEGKLKVIHLKDLNTELEDAVWGTGILPVKEVVTELRRQNFDGLISIEYENFSGTQMDDISESLEFLNQIID